ncbi:alpha/beta hydrolase family protein [Usitatibacter palustris]|nr:prolyl oligopeptidase family serine peptidase [Usitatibacter palustris]
MSALAFVLAMAAVAVQAKPTPPTIQQLAAFPKMSGFTISPDGKHIAGLESRGEERVILVWGTDALDKPPVTIGSQRMKITGVQFIKNDLLAVSMWQPYDARLDKLTKTFVNKLFITDLGGKNWNEPIPQDRGMSRIEEKLIALSNPTVLDRLVDDPDHILVVNDVRGSAGDVFKVNVRNNRAERVHRADEKIAGYVTDLDGNIRARERADVDTTGAYVVAEIKEPSGNWVEHFRSYVKERDEVRIAGFAKDPNIAFVVSNVGLDKAVIYEYDVAARKRKEILFQHRFFDASGVLINRSKNSGDVPFGEILGVTYDGPRSDLYDVQWTSPKAQARDKGIRDALGLKRRPLKVTDTENGQSAEMEYDLDASYRILSSTADLANVVFAVDGAARPPEYYLLRNGKLTMLAKAYPEVDTASLGKARLVYYKARDGLDIPAFVTTPSTDLCGPAPWPAVVHPHGGPWARDGMEFDGSMWVPLMTSRCMAVLQPQFRGSNGWGRKLWKAGDAEWGQKMQDDKDDGAKWLVDQGIAQKGRIAMFGFSYGGYSAMAASVRPNGLYKCAIAGAGVSDHKRIWAQFYTNPFFRERQSATVNGLNPIDKANAIEIPIMVYHGDRDQTVPLEQSDWFVSKAKSSKQPVVYHEIADYAHGPAWTRKIMGDQLKIIEDYLLKDCGAKGL